MIETFGITGWLTSEFLMIRVHPDSVASMSP